MITEWNIAVPFLWLIYSSSYPVDACVKISLLCETADRPACPDLLVRMATVMSLRYPPPRDIMYNFTRSLSSHCGLVLVLLFFVEHRIFRQMPQPPPEKCSDKPRRHEDGEEARRISRTFHPPPPPPVPPPILPRSRLLTPIPLGRTVGRALGDQAPHHEGRPPRLPRGKRRHSP